jgi:hypothetical protein
MLNLLVPSSTVLQVYLELLNAHDQLVRGKVCPMFMSMHGAIVDKDDRLWTYCQDAGSLNIKEYLDSRYPFNPDGTPCSGRIRYVTNAVAALLEGATYADREWEVYLPDLKSSNIMVDDHTCKPTVIDPTGYKKADPGGILFSTAGFSSPEVGLGIIARQLCPIGLSPLAVQGLVEDEKGSFPWIRAMGQYLDPSVNPLNEVTAGYSIAALVEELLLPAVWDEDAAVADDLIANSPLLVRLRNIISKEQIEEVAALMTSVLRDPEEVVAAAADAQLPEPLQDFLSEALVTEPENRSSLQRLSFLVMQAVAEVNGWEVERAAGARVEWSYVPPSEGEWAMFGPCDVSNDLMMGLWSSSQGGITDDVEGIPRCDFEYATCSHNRSSSNNGSYICAPRDSSDADSSVLGGLTYARETTTSSSDSGSPASVAYDDNKVGGGATCGMYFARETTSSSSNNNCSPACLPNDENKVGSVATYGIDFGAETTSSSSNNCSPACLPNDDNKVGSVATCGIDFATETTSSSSNCSPACLPDVGSYVDGGATCGINYGTETITHMSSSNSGSDTCALQDGSDANCTATCDFVTTTGTNSSRSRSNNGSGSVRDSSAPLGGTHVECTATCAMSPQVGITSSSNKIDSGVSSTSSSPSCDTTHVVYVLPAEQHQPLQQPSYISTSSSGQLIGLQLLLLASDSDVSRKLQIDPVACAADAAETAINLKPCVLGSKIQGVMTALESRGEAAATPSSASSRVVNAEESLFKGVGQWMAKVAASITQSWLG